MDATHPQHDSMHSHLDAASRRVDQSISEMLSLLEDEIADGEYDAKQGVARARIASFGVDERW